MKESIRWARSPQPVSVLPMRDYARIDEASGGLPAIPLDGGAPVMHIGADGYRMKSGRSLLTFDERVHPPERVQGRKMVAGHGPHDQDGFSDRDSAIAKVMVVRVSRTAGFENLTIRRRGQLRADSATPTTEAVQWEHMLPREPVLGNARGECYFTQDFIKRRHLPFGASDAATLNQIGHNGRTTKEAHRANKIVR